MNLELQDVMVQYYNGLIETTPLEYFVNNIIPIIQLIVVVLGAFAGLHKYYKTKDKERNEKIMSEVYAPLFSYFVKQEVYRDLFMPGFDYTDSPVLEVTHTCDGVRKPLCGLHRDSIIELKSRTNFGLAPSNITVLLNMYEVLVEIEKQGEGTDTSEPFLKSTILKVNVERELRKEIIEGYQKYHKSLDVENINDSFIWEIVEDTILFDYEISKKEILKLGKDMEENPDKYVQ